LNLSWKQYVMKTKFQWNIFTPSSECISEWQILSMMAASEILWIFWSIWYIGFIILHWLHLHSVPFVYIRYSYFWSVCVCVCVCVCARALFECQTTFRRLSAYNDIKRIQIHYVENIMFMMNAKISKNEQYSIAYWALYVLKGKSDMKSYLMCLRLYMFRHRLN